MRGQDISGFSTKSGLPARIPKYIQFGIPVIKKHGHILFLKKTMVTVTAVTVFMPTDMFNKKLEIYALCSLIASEDCNYDKLYPLLITGWGQSQH